MVVRSTLVASILALKVAACFFIAAIFLPLGPTVLTAAVVLLVAGIVGLNAALVLRRIARRVDELDPANDAEPTRLSEATPSR